MVSMAKLRARWIRVLLAVSAAGLGAAGILLLAREGLDRADKLSSVLALFASVGFGVVSIVETRRSRMGIGPTETAASPALSQPTVPGAAATVLHSVPDALPSFIGRTGLLGQILRSL